jgi:hypothetical protein
LIDPVIVGSRFDASAASRVSPCWSSPSARYFVASTDRTPIATTALIVVMRRGRSLRPKRPNMAAPALKLPGHHRALT